MSFYTFFDLNTSEIHLIIHLVDLEFQWVAGLVIPLSVNIKNQIKFYADKDVFYFQ